MPRKCSIDKTPAGQSEGRSCANPEPSPPVSLIMVHVREVVGGHDVRTVAIDPERSEHVRWAFKAFATGDYSLSSLTEALAERGLVSVPKPTRPEKPVSRSQVHRMLGSSYYIGIVTYAGAEYEGAHEPLVDMKTWRAVQDMLTSRNRATDRSSRHQHYLKGTLFCGHCGARMAVTHSRGRGGVYEYFYCLGHNKGRSDCPLGYLPIAEVADKVARYYKHVELPDDQIEAIASAVGTHIKLMQKQNGKEVDRQRRRLHKAEDEQRKLLQAHYAGAVPLELLKEEQDRLGREIRSARSIITDCEEDFDMAQQRLTVATSQVHEVERAYLHADDRARRALNQAIFEKIFVTEDGVKGADLTAPYAQLLDTDLSTRLDIENEKSVGELLNMNEDTNLNYEKQVEGWTDPGEYTLHPVERPNGLLPVDMKNPGTYCRRRGSNVSFLAEGMGFEPMVTRRPQRLSRPPHSSALATFRRRD